jgi:hypothetical protein
MSVCYECGLQVPTKSVEFRQNIGALVMRFSRTWKGDICKSCSHGVFWKMTLITLAVGWLGTISLIMAPIFIISNIVQYILCLTLPSADKVAAVPEPAAPAPIAPIAPMPPPSVPAAFAPAPPMQAPAPVLTEQAVEALNPYADQIIARLNAQEDHQTIANEMAATAGTTPGQVLLYIQALYDQSSPQESV